MIPKTSDEIEKILNSCKAISDAQNTWEWFLIALYYNRGVDDSLINSSIDIICKNTITIPTGTVLFRARIVKNSEINMLHTEAIDDSSKNSLTGMFGFDKQNMIAPPADKASAGRANHSKNSILYVANTPETALCEVRPGFMDYISLAKFKLKKDIVVADLTDIFNIDDEKYRKIQSNFCLKEIQRAFTQPFNEQNDTVYAPSQYIANKLKNRNLDGIKYNSGRNNRNGVQFNIAIYDSSVAECIDDFGTLYQCTSSQFRFENITRLPTEIHEGGFEFHTPKWEDNEILKLSEDMRITISRLNNPDDKLFLLNHKSLENQREKFDSLYYP